MKVYSLKQNIGKININEHILPIFLINLINILANTIIYKETNNNHILKNRMSEFHQTKSILISVLRLACWVYSNDPKVSFYFPETSFRTSFRHLGFEF